MALLDIFDPQAPPRAVGIDLGTTHSLVAYVRDGTPTCIQDCDLQTLLPSAVHYAANGHVVVGADALRRATVSPRETIVSVKRFMGRGARDPETQRLGPYTFVPPSSPAEEAYVRFAVYDRALTPVEISAEILRALKRRAEDELSSVGGAVITVPAYFDDAQRQATKDAGRLAGWNVLRLLNEPTAAALAYGLEKGKQGTFAVYDLGGGTFDVTLLTLDSGVFHVRATGGDTALGGDDFDRLLAEELFLPFLGADTPARCTPDVIRFAVDTARRVKHQLTVVETVDVLLPVDGSQERPLTVTRVMFERLIRPLLERTGAACRRALRDAGLDLSNVDGVILVGGSTRVPAVRAYVKGFFEREPLCDLNPDEVVALGAAIQADILAGEGRDDVLLLDVLPLSLGLETMGGVVDKILPRNTTLPASARSTFTTYADNQTGFELQVVQGEREFAADCRSLAKFTLKGIPPLPAGMARLDVTFHVDADGLLRVTAKETTTGVEQQIDVTPSYGLDDEQVEAMLLAALDHGEVDLEARRLAEGRVEAERILVATRSALATESELLSPEEQARVAKAVTAIEQAMGGTNASVLRGRMDDLDQATHAWAGRRLDRAVARAIAGQRLGDVEASVAHAKGIEKAHAAGKRGS